MRRVTAKSTILKVSGGVDVTNGSPSSPKYRVIAPVRVVDAAYGKNMHVREPLP